MTDENTNPPAESGADETNAVADTGDDTTESVDRPHAEAAVGGLASDEPISDTVGAPVTAPSGAGSSSAPTQTAARPASAPAAAAQDPMMSDEYSSSFPSLKEGDVVQGVVVHIDKDGVLVDVGTKSEGIIRRNEISRDPSVNAEDIIKVGERIDVYVMETENQDGNLILSKKRADFEKAWERVQEARETGATLNAMVTDRVKGGLVVDLGIRGFVPASHVGNGSMKNNLEKYVGQSIPLKVIEVDKERRKVVLSNKLAADEDRLAKKAETVGSLQPGQVRRGIVRRLTNYGAFVDLGGIDGLLHISEMSWTRINHPQEVLKEGQEIDVVVLKMDLEAGRVSLGLRQILPDPWANINETYHPGDVIIGSVTRVVPFGVFVQVEGGIEGIIPNSELGARRGGKGGVQLQQGQEVEVKVLDVRPEERKMSLSLRRVKQGDEFVAVEDAAPAEGRAEGEVRSSRRGRDEEPDYDYGEGGGREGRGSRGGREGRGRDRTEEYRNEEPRFTIGDAFRAQQEAEASDSDTDTETEEEFEE